jgi:polyisoprenoid-binding protein YceI
MIFSRNVRALLLILPLSLAQAGWSKSYQAIKGESTLSYRLVHPMHKINGVSKDFLCTVDLSPDTVSSIIKVSAAISSFDTKNSSRDSHAMEVLEARKYPKVEFASQSVKPEGDGYLVAGTLTFHGRAKPISFHVTPHFLDRKVEITGGFDVKLSDFEVKRPSLLFVSVEDKVTIRFDLFAPAD